MAENYQNSLSSEDPDPDHLSFPEVTDSPSMGRGLQNFSRPSVPATSSAWLVPSGSSQPIQANPGNTNAFTYQPPETGLWPEAHGAGVQTQLSNSFTPYPAVFDWGVKGHSYGAVEISACFPVALVAQEVSKPVPSVSPHINHSSRVSPMGHRYGHIQPPANACLLQRQPSNMSVQAHLSQGHGQQVPLQDWRGANLCNHDMRDQESGELGCVVQRGRSIKVPANAQSEILLVLKAIQPMGTCASSSVNLNGQVSAQPRDSRATDLGLKVVDTLPGMLHEPRTFCLRAPAQQGGGVKTIRTEMSSEALDRSQMPQGSQGPPLFPLEIPDINQLMAYIDPVQAPNTHPHNNRLIGPRQVAGGDSLKEIPLGKHIAQENIKGNSPLNITQPALTSDSQKRASWLAPGKGKSPRKVSKQVELPPTAQAAGSDKVLAESEAGIVDPQKLGANHSEKPTATEPALPPVESQTVGTKRLRDEKDLATKEMQMEIASRYHLREDQWEGNLENCHCTERISQTKCVTTFGDARESPCKQRTTDIQRQPLRKTIDQAEVSKLEERPQKRLSSLRNDKGKSTNQGRGKLKLEDKQHGIQEGGKTSQPGREPFKMPRSHLGLHMLESIQVFHPLGKKLIPLGPGRGALQSDKGEGSSSSAWPKPLLGLKRPAGPPEDSKSIAYHPACSGRRNGQWNVTGKLCPASGNSRPVAPAAPRHLALKQGSSRANHTKLSFGNDLPPPHSPTPLWSLSSASTWRPGGGGPLQELEVSLPIPLGQRGERDGRKRKAQEERELTAQYTALGKRQFFVERERDLAIEEEFGYI